MESNSLSGTLRACLREYKKRYPNLSEGQIARKIGIPQSTLNRVMNDPAIPKLDTIIKIIMGTGSEEFLEQILNSYDRGLGHKLKMVFEDNRNDSKKVWTDFELEELLSDPDVFVAHSLASKDKGIEKSLVVGVLGVNGLKAMDKLIDAGVVFKDGKKFKTRDDKQIVRSPEAVKRHLSTYARHLKTEHIGMERNYLHSHSEFLNREALKNLHLMHKDFSRSIADFFDDENNHGDHPAFSVGFTDTFTTDPSLIDKEILQ